MTEESCDPSMIVSLTLLNVYFYQFCGTCSLIPICWRSYQSITVLVELPAESFNRRKEGCDLSLFHLGVTSLLDIIHGGGLILLASYSIPAMLIVL